MEDKSVKKSVRKITDTVDNSVKKKTVVKKSDSIPAKKTNTRAKKIEESNEELNELFGNSARIVKSQVNKGIEKKEEITKRVPTATKKSIKTTSEVIERIDKKPKTKTIEAVKKTTMSSIASDPMLKKVVKKSEESKVDPKVAKKTSTKVAQTTLTKNGAKIGTKTVAKKVSEKASDVKKIISEEVAKASSEKTSSIKINKNATSEVAKRKAAKPGSTKTNESNLNSENIKTQKVGVNQKKKATTIPYKVSKINEIENEYEKEINLKHLDEELNEKIDFNEFDRELKNRTYISKKERVGLIKKIVYNIIYMGLFIGLLVFSYYGLHKIGGTTFIKDLNILAFTFLGIALILIEIAFNKDNIEKCITGIESLIMGIFTLFLPYLYQITKKSHSKDFVKILILAGIINITYYAIKMIILFLDKKKRFLRKKDDYIKEFEDSIDLFGEDEEEE